MNAKHNTLMLGIIFAEGNMQEARRTARAFSDAFAQAEMVLGVETSLSRADKDPAKRSDFLYFLNERMHENWKGVYLWDAKCDEAFFERWTSASGSLPMPFYREGFSYGGSFNRLIALAKVAGCAHLIRVDAGTAPLPCFHDVIAKRVQLVASKQADVVSGGYKGRLAIREDFVSARNKDAYREIIQASTGITPAQQLTGGAGLVVGVPQSPPAIPFDGLTPVWGSDDGFFKLVLGDEAQYDPERSVERRESGTHARVEGEYLARLASMVVLKGLHDAAEEPQPDQQLLLDRATQFLDQVGNLEDGLSALKADASQKLRERINRIVTGHSNYARLREEWPTVVARIAELAETFDPIAWCRVR